MNTLIAFDDTTPDAGFSWYLKSSNGLLDALEPDEAALDDTSSRVLLIVSGRDVFLSEIDTVARTEKEIRETALFQLEDELAEPIGQLHVALGPRNPDHPRRRKVAIVSKKRMAGWLEAVSAVSPALAERVSIIPDTSLFSDTDDAFIYDGDGQFLLAQGDGPLSLDPAHVHELLPALLQDYSADKIPFIQGDGAMLSSEASVSGVNFEAAGESHYVDLISERLSFVVGLDLRQTPFARKSKLRFDLGVWQKSAVLAASVILAWLAFLGVSTLQLNQEADALYEKARAAYVSVYPDEPRAVDPHRLSQAKLRTLGGGASSSANFGGLLSAFYKGLEQVEGVELVSFNYSGETGRLSASLKFTSYQDRDALKQAFDQMGLSMQLGGARQEEGFLIGQAVIGGSL